MEELPEEQRFAFVAHEFDGRSFRELSAETGVPVNTLLSRKRYAVLPGMTGLWQVSGRIDLSFDDLVRLDFYYLENWSIWLDISILAKTLPAVLARRGAY